MKKYLTIIIFMILASDCISENPTGSSWESISKNNALQFLEKANSWFLNNQNYAVYITHKSFVDYNSKSAADSSSGYFVKREDTFFSSLMGIQALTNREYSIIVDSSSKSIQVCNSKKNLYRAINIESIKQSLTDCKNILQSTQKGKTVLKFNFEKGELNKAELEFDANNRIVKMICYYKNKLLEDEQGNEIRYSPRLEIVLSKYDDNIAAFESSLSVGNYISSASGKLIASGKYKHFTMSDLRIK